MLVFRVMFSPGRLAFFAILAAALSAYSNSFHVPFIFDDIHSIVRNRGLRDLSDLKAVFTSDSPGRPFLFLTFALNFAAGGLNPFGYHVGNFALHVLASFLVFRIISEILKKSGAENGLCAALGAMIFALHPLNVEAVTYTASRSSVLAACLYLLAFMLMITSAPGTGNPFRAALLFFILALLTKEEAVTLPALLTLYALQFEGREALRRRAPALAFFWLALPMFFIYRAFVLGHPLEPPDPERELDSKTYFLTQLVVVPFGYLPRLLVPIFQVFDADSEWKRSVMDWRVAAGGGVVLFLLAYAFVNFRKNRVVSFSILWFFGALSVTSSFWPILDAYTERRLYIAMPAFCLAVAYFVHASRSRFPAWKKAVTAVAAVMLVVFGGLTWSRNRLFMSPKLVWEDTIRKTWGKWRLYSGLAYEYVKEGDYEKAEETIKFASVKFPEKEEIKLVYCWVLGARGKFVEMEKALSAARPVKPEDVSSYLNYKGILEGRKGNPEAARKHFGSALALNRENVDARANMAVLMKMEGNVSGAVEWLAKAAAEFPLEADYRYQLGNMLSETDKTKAAVEYGKAMELDPFHERAKNALKVLKGAGRL